MSTGVLCVAGIVATCGNLASAESVSESGPRLVKSRASERHLGKMLNDLLSDFLNQLVNAAKVGKPSVTVRNTSAIKQVAEVLKSAGYLKKITLDGLSLQADLNPDLPVSHIKRLSKPSLRHYVKSALIPQPRHGIGMIIMSTPKGMLSGFQARKQKVGGELICEVW